MQTIDLVSFLRNYYGISNENLTLKKLTHEDVMELFPYVKESERENITLEDIICGNVIGVYDKHKRVVYYYNPHLEIEKEDVPIYSNIDEEDEVIHFTLEDLENLSKEELLSLRRKLRLNNQRKDSYMVNALIKKIKRKEPKKYRENKEKLLIKERMNYND